MAILGFFPKKSFVQVTAHFLFVATSKKKPWSQLKMIFQTQEFSSLFVHATFGHLPIPHFLIPN
jgi:hypothetical protein